MDREAGKMNGMDTFDLATYTCNRLNGMRPRETATVIGKTHTTYPGKEPIECYVLRYDDGFEWPLTINTIGVGELSLYVRKRQGNERNVLWAPSQNFG